MSDDNVNVVRVAKDARYFVASNIPFNDKNLSWEARGLMGYLLSKPNDWQVSMANLVNESPAGMKVVRRILAELRKAGYMRRERVTVSHGHFKWITTLYESSELNKSTMLPSRIDGSRIDAKGVNIVSTESLSTDLEKEEDKTVFTFYQNNIALITSFTKDELGEMIDQYSAHWVMEALKDCVEYNAKNLKYAKAILAGWKAKGFRSDTRSQAKAAKNKLPYSAPQTPVRHI